MPWEITYKIPQTYTYLIRICYTVITVRGHLSISLPYLLNSLLSSYPLNPYSTLCICTHHHQGSTTSISNSRWLRILEVVDSRLLPPLAPPPPRTSIGYIGTHPRDTTAPSASRGLRIRRGLEAWCCIGHYINVLRPNQGSSERSLWISPD
jgi:hypothetical protein